MGSNQELGQAGEDAVAEWYARRGFELVDRNWRTRDGEIDLVAARITGETDVLLAFVEVKTRSSARFGSGLEAIGPEKLARMRRMGAAWLQAHPSSVRRSVRFDVASITGETFTLVVGVC